MARSAAVMVAVGRLVAARRDALNEFVYPRDRGIEIGQHADLLDRRLVEEVPTFAGYDGRWPSLLASVLDETFARRPDQSEVEVLALVE